ncbi:hypothetical protein J437_LFUL013943 [Ladona fulva]|uniref:BESS domain-containing protein n=1 Tax=Ladona fulva TaxID=123851 RepID=A0A8K0KKB4_LADFU|nr:hypothetical protein J437_LFUL013943 [Ladona fulva]
MTSHCTARAPVPTTCRVSLRWKMAQKVEDSTKTGAGTKEAYKPEWFAYQKMASFLHSIYIPRKTKTSDEGPENEEDDRSTYEHPTPDPAETSDINTACGDEESRDAAVTEAIDQGGPPQRRKRKVEKPEIIEKRMDEAYSLLKQVANKPKAAKDESALFSDLLCVKLRALDDDTRELAMHEINNLMFNLKKPKIQQPYWSYGHNYQQPNYFANTVPHGRSVNPAESSVDGSENSFSSCASSGHNPLSTSTQQYGSNDNQMEMPCRNVAEYVHTFNAN